MSILLWIPGLIYLGGVLFYTWEHWKWRRNTLEWENKSRRVLWSDRMIAGTIILCWPLVFLLRMILTNLKDSL